MIKKAYMGLESRDNLAKELVQLYTNKNAPTISCITGNHGTGKSYVIHKIINQLTANKKISIYQNFGDSFVAFDSKSTKNTPNSLSLSGGNAIFSLGFGVGWEKKDTSYNRIRNLLAKILVSDILFCVDGLSNADSGVRAMIMLIIQHIQKLQNDFKVTIYILVTEIDIDNIFINHYERIVEYNLLKYKFSDIKMYLTQNHKIVSLQEQEIKTISELCNGNLNLVEFMYEEKITYGSNFLDAMEKVCQIRIEQLKQLGKKENLDETELEEVIYSASLNIKEFTAEILSEVVKQEEKKIYRELNIAKEEALIIQNLNNYYDFCSYEIKSHLAEQTIPKRKEWLLAYYVYYTNNEQDQYFYRAYYLMKYQGKLTMASFSLLMLSYSVAFEMRDIVKTKQIREVLCNSTYIPEQYIKIFENIESFYNLLHTNDNGNILKEAFYNINLDELDLPLRAELTRAYFHYLYVNSNMNNAKSLLILEWCKEFSKNELCLDIPYISFDETILRLRIIYDIAPCVLDCLNQYDEFQVLFEKSKELSRRNIKSLYGRNLGLYIENVFNRKAFLFVNQTQCAIYYHKAKKYFKINEIWDEYCITLVCEAGTDIVLQQYDEAIGCCNQVLLICQDKNIQLPLIEKLYNNKIIAEFLSYEKTTLNQRSRDSAAKKAIKELKKLLLSRSCATEFVILTNICSLSLYCNNDKQYTIYKKKIEKLYGCQDISDIDNLLIDDFYRYYFSWFELYRNIRDEHWDNAKIIINKLEGFVPSLFRKQEVFWNQKNAAIKELITSQKVINSYDFCNNLVKYPQRENVLARFFHRGLMLSDLQYTSYL